MVINSFYFQFCFKTFLKNSLFFMYVYAMYIMCEMCIFLCHIYPTYICRYTQILHMCICTYHTRIRMYSHVCIVFTEFQRGHLIPLEICLRITVSHHMDFRDWFQVLYKKEFSHLPSQPSSLCFQQSNDRQDLVLSFPTLLPWDST